MKQTTEAKNYICVNCKLVTNHKQKRCIQCGCQTHEQTAADVTYPADTRHEAMTTEAKDKTRYRIIWPNDENRKRVPDITHWIFAADRKHKPIFYGAAHFAFFKDGRMIEGYQLHKEF